MPRGVYEHKPSQGFQKGNTIWLGKKLTEEHKAKLCKPKAKPSHFKGRTYQEIYGDRWMEEVERRRSSRIAYHDKVGRSGLFKRPKHWGWAYDRFARLVFERDGFACVLCGVMGSKSGLNADHYPESFSSICKRFDIKTMAEAMACDALWDIANGRTLCVACHRKTHNYGKHEYSAEMRRKVGEANRSRKRVPRFSNCHPDRKHFCRGMCVVCYRKWYRQERGKNA